MHDNSSFHLCSRAGEQGVSIAVEAQMIVRDAARPVSPGESIKAQMRRAWVALGRPPYWRVRAAWYCESGTWSAVAFEDFRTRYRNWKERQEAKGRAAADTARERLEAMHRALSAADADFHRDTLLQIERALRDMGGGVGPGSVGKSG